MYQKSNSFKYNLIKNISNMPGWLTNRQILVIESDDWGSLRMPSVDIYKLLSNKGLDLSSGDALRYNLYDSLATTDDLSSLFEILMTIKDLNNNPGVLTPVSIVANPDFEKIKMSNFCEYHFEPFTETLKKSPACENAFALWQEGIKNHIFVPQFHGREHLNVQVWMNALKNNESSTRLAFENGIWGFNNKNTSGISYQAAFDLDNPVELEYQKEVIISGLELFNKLFGYKATFFVPPNGPFNEKLEETAFKCGIQYMSAARIHREPLGHGHFKNKIHFMGQKNKLGQRYITRNCFFEPSQPGKDWVNSCLNDIAIAFRWKKPAVISTHRVNFIGALDVNNRIKGLKQLQILLSTIKEKWPRVEFMTSEELGRLMNSDRKQY